MGQRTDTTRFEASVQTSSLVGRGLSINVARLMDDQWAAGAHVTQGPRRREVMVSGLWSPMIERDGMAIPNAGSQGGSLVSVQGGRVDINLNQFPPPSPGGQDNYRILMPQAGGQVIEINFTVVNR
ncbi:hypothetical protein [Hydrogenophaga sp.]|uniref:hypothetical protein n=1 Tax=Hydrogenophaga sp. TaxID=1904254 RepID=UPI00391DBD90